LDARIRLLKGFDSVSKSIAITLLVLTIIPLIFFLIFLGLTFAIPLEEQVKGGALDSPTLADLQVVFLVWTILLGLYYLFRIISNRAIPQERKLLWIIFILAGGHIAMIAYWYKYFWGRE
jgi:hypothetical protein